MFLNYIKILLNENSLINYFIIWYNFCHNFLTTLFCDYFTIFKTDEVQKTLCIIFFIKI